jgi:hypothetical protein
MLHKKSTTSTIKIQSGFWTSFFYIQQGNHMLSNLGIAPLKIA